MVDPQLNTTSPWRDHSCALGNLLHAEDVFTMWHCQNSNKRAYRYFFPKHSSLFSNIDMFLVDKQLLQRMSSISDMMWLDYAAITIMIEEKDTWRTIHMWQFKRKLIMDVKNNALLTQHLCDFFTSMTSWTWVFWHFGMPIRHKAWLNCLLENIHSLECQNKYPQTQLPSFLNWDWEGYFMNNTLTSYDISVIDNIPTITKQQNS